MSTKTRATIEDLYKVEGKAELVKGRSSRCRHREMSRLLRVLRFLCGYTSMPDAPPAGGYTAMGQVFG